MALETKVKKRFSNVINFKTDVINHKINTVTFLKKGTNRDICKYIIHNFHQSIPVIVASCFSILS